MKRIDLNLIDLEMGEIYLRERKKRVLKLRSSADEISNGFEMMKEMRRRRKNEKMYAAGKEKRFTN
jgi:hypothetical protein